MRLASFLCVYLLVPLAYAQPASQPTTTFDPSAIIARVKERYPELAILKAEAKAAKLRIPQASALEDPRVALMPNFINPTIKGQGEVELWVKQELPGPGKRALREKVASLNSEALSLDLIESQRAATLMAWKSITTIATLDTEREVTAHHLSFVETIIKTAEASFVTKQSSLSDVLSARTRQAELENRLLELKLQRSVEVATLNFLMGLPQTTQLAAAPAISIQPVKSSLDELLAQALKARPSSQAASIRIKGANVQVELAKKERQPDYNVGLALMPQFDGTLQFGGFVEVMVPLYRKNKQDKALEEAIAVADAERAKLSAEESTIEEEVSLYYATFSTFLAQLELLDTKLVPTATLTYEAALASYQANQSLLRDVLQAEIELLRVEIMRQQLRSEALLARANLEAAVGGALERGAP